MRLLAILCSFISGFMLSYIGFPVWTWQFWAVIIPTNLCAAFSNAARKDD
ncbi:MAG: hypothetical protein RI930_220 [Pseudomonadota bacterium]|jgi:hypothetical protein